MATFVIKHKSGGKYLHHSNGRKNPGNDQKLVLCEGTDDQTHFTFDVEDDHWGYIRHVASGKVIHPYGGDFNPRNNADLVLHEDRHGGALFCIDSANDAIMHIGGKFVHPKGGSHKPENNTQVCLHQDQHYQMKFECVSPNNTSEEALVYGAPTLRGKWKIINMVMNPAAVHKQTFQYKVGKSKTESTTYSFSFKWETTASVSAGIGSASASASLSSMFERSSASTWSEETTVKREITVNPGESVVTWQFVFTCEQLNHRAKFYSNLLADTRSPTDVPDDIAAIGF
ncbi:galactose-binding lectin-like [Mytilus californianus]|uniref:galactose-binding lectin-like n=1 Tax=Mytilus californianus TaxID=6549 RepID=UPI002245FAB1|nr:galactose-binding lectin-like [Mytilus californianus]